ncbi:MAG: acyclic terpene utilization AtuA family protein [Candidatus Rokubacteria bacterium]|nr:acyclic terpene utilization AtuA family protein [Candidatus Rokubacteria bacterium]
MDECRILAPLGMLGYGFPLASFEAGLLRRPHVIAADAGSTDGGPHKLGAGVGIVSRAATKKDLGAMLRGGLDLGVPVIVGSAGGSGAEVHLAWTREILEELIREDGRRLRVAYVHAELDKEFLKSELAAGRITPLRGVPSLTDKAIDSATRIVAQMGAEPLIRALETGAQVIIAGRAYDPACFAAWPLWKGFAEGPAWHLGKILECGALAADPGSPGDAMLGVLRSDGFVVEPLNPARRCTETSVAAHTLYEKSHPYLLPGPGGLTDLSGCTFRQIGDRAVEVRGSAFHPSTPYTVKLEGAELCAYRTVVLAGIRDPLMLAELHASEEAVVDLTRDYFDRVPRGDYRILFHHYGIDGVMGASEPLRAGAGPHEVGLVIEVVAATQELADAICAFVRATLIHYAYPGRKATAGNLAFPFAPSDVRLGPVYRFNVYHLLAVEDPAAPFPVELVEY